jgi:hypothetical protein
MNLAPIPVSQLLIRSLALGCTVRTLRLRLTKTLHDYYIPFYLLSVRGLSPVHLFPAIGTNQLHQDPEVG